MKIQDLRLAPAAVERLDELNVLDIDLPSDGGPSTAGRWIEAALSEFAALPLAEQAAAMTREAQRQARAALDDARAFLATVRERQSEAEAFAQSIEGADPEIAADLRREFVGMVRKARLLVGEVQTSVDQIEGRL